MLRWWKNKIDWRDKHFKFCTVDWTKVKKTPCCNQPCPQELGTSSVVQPESKPALLIQSNNQVVEIFLCKCVVHVPWGYNGFTMQLHWSTPINPSEILGGALRMQAYAIKARSKRYPAKRGKAMWEAQFRVQKTSQPCIDPICPNPVAAHGQPRTGAALHQTQRPPARAKSNISNCWKRKHDVQGSHEDHMRITWGSWARLRQCQTKIFEERLWKSSKCHPCLQASPVPGRSRESLQPVPAATAAAVVAALEPNAQLVAVRTNLRARGGRVKGS